MPTTEFPEWCPCVTFTISTAFIVSSINHFYDSAFGRPIRYRFHRCIQFCTPLLYRLAVLQSFPPQPPLRALDSPRHADQCVAQIPRKRRTKIFPLACCATTNIDPSHSTPSNPVPSLADLSQRYPSSFIPTHRLECLEVMNSMTFICILTSPY
ncbi:hypothetical protein ASPVEDRAFT_299122 [Aspergillus versicolor CBS 583.65]|uniref:Uncharacterized protein n=1 Tax=Aspergillus versicolor CBS 583.65 TaxID=1036611 RepID=A0A1L9P7P6_ASPVE|nr:uncharacterized protein ASPVEDRAFT_299122 [Aspergillus versicolor CBS 583.65]OJI97535.1 hypothetical protein ASPVEDRAFT_299122 [Aspergillus versicolor CBS 583.65]